MKYRIKAKIAWHLRKWANKLSPAPIVVPKPIMYRGKEYELQPLSLKVDAYDFWGEGRINFEVARGKHQIAEAVREIIEVKTFEGDGPKTDRILQLLILTPKDRIYEYTED